MLCVSIGYWKVLIISGTYVGEPQPAVSNQSHAAGGDVNGAKADDTCSAKFSKKHTKSSKYFVTPRPPTSQLVLVIYGDLDKTVLLPLTTENPQDVSFEPGQAEEFKVSQQISHEPVVMCFQSINQSYLLLEHSP